MYIVYAPDMLLHIQDIVSGNSSARNILICDNRGHCVAETFVAFLPYGRMVRRYLAKLPLRLQNLMKIKLKPVMTRDETR